MKKEGTTRTVFDLDETLGRDALFLGQIAYARREALKVSFCCTYKGAYICCRGAPAAAGYGGYGETHELASEVGETEEVVGQGEREELLCDVTFRY